MLNQFHGFQIRGSGQAAPRAPRSRLHGLLKPISVFPHRRLPLFFIHFLQIIFPIHKIFYSLQEGY
jgi:hypothetical protein